MVEQPVWVGVAGVLLASAVVGVVRGGRRSWRWRMAGVMLPLMAAALAALALARPGMMVKGDRVVILLDLSASTRQSPWHDPAWVRKLAEARLGPDREVTVVGFDAGEWLLLNGVRAGDGLAWPGAWPANAGGARESEGSNAYGALAWRSEAEQRGAALAPRWIITDGLVESWKSPAMDSRAAAFPVAWTTVPPEAIDVGVTDVELRAVQNGSQPQVVEVMAQIRAVGRLAKGKVAQQVAVGIFRDGQSIAEVPLAFSSEAAGRESLDGWVDASRWISVTDGFSPGVAVGVHQYEVKAGAKEQGDPWPENDVGRMVWMPLGQPRILVVGAHPSAADTLGEGMTYISSDQFPVNASILAAQGWQSIVLDDLAAAKDLPASVGRAIDSFVTETGGGLLMVRRGRPFLPESWGDFTGTWGYLEKLSPVSSWPEKKSGLQLVFLLDASASMNEAASSPGGRGGGGENKYKVAAQAGEQAAKMLPVQDRLTVIIFHDRAEVVADGLRGQVDASLEKNLRGVKPGGATDVDSALPAVERALAAAGDGGGEQRKLVVLLTDGEIPAMDIAAWKKILAAGGEKAPTQLAIIAPHAKATPGAAAGLLQQLADAVAGTQWLDTNDPGAWSGLLIRVLGEQLAGRPHETRLAWRIVDGSAAGTALPWSDAWIKPEAALIAEGRDGERSVPVAAVVQRGLGRVAAVEMGNDGTALGYPELMKQLLARVAAPAGDRRFVLGAHKAVDGDWVITADGADGKGFLDHEQLRAAVAAGPGENGGEATDTLFRQTAAGHYEGNVRADGAMVATISREVRTGNGATTQRTESFVGQLRLPDVQTNEWPASVDHPLTAARLPAGVLALSADLHDASRWNPPALWSIALAPLCWALAVLAALTAMWLRH